MIHFFHDWIYSGKVAVVAPKRGPFDPRTDEQRTVYDLGFVCAKCGKTENRSDGGRW